MKIKSVEIYGYGQFVQRRVEFNEYFTELYGENEAGKSTLQAFIHSILFGFPTKREHEPRLEPRMGNHYGGRVTLIMDDSSEIVVERVKGSAQGDVKVYLPNGSIKDESWLKEHLNFIDKRTYQSIFSFSVLGLQDIHKHLTENQLQNFLMQAGALGSTEFIGMRDLISSKKQELYKKAGQNPEINRQIEELKNLELQIRDKSSELETYQRLTETRDKSQKRLDTLKQNLSHLNQFYEEKQKELALHDQVQEWKGLESDLNIEPLAFPEQGIDRYEAAKFQTQQLERDIGLREEKRIQLEHDNQALSIPKADHFKQIEALSKKEESIKQDEFDLKQVRRDIDHHQRDLEGLCHNIGWDKVYEGLDTSEVQVSYTSHLLKEYDEQLLTIQRLKHTHDEYQIETKTYENEINDLENQLVSEEDFEKKQIHEKQLLELNEKRNLFTKMKETFEQEYNEKQKKKHFMRIMLVLLAVVSLGLATFAFVTSNLLFSAAFAVLAVLCLLGLFLTKSKEVSYNQRFADEITELENQVTHLENAYNLDFNLNHQFQLRDQVAQRKQSLKILTLKFQNILQQLKQTEENIDVSRRKINDIKANIHVSENLSNDLLVDGFHTIQKINEHQDHLNELKESESHLMQSLEQFYTQAKEKVEMIFGHFNAEAMFHDLREWIKRVQSDSARFERNQEQIDLIQNEVKHLKSRLKENHLVIQNLFSSIGALDEESYYKHFDRYQTYQTRLSRFNDLTLYLENQDYGYEKSSKLSEKTTVQLETEFEKLSDQIDTYNENFLELQSEVSDLTAQINHMETDDTLRQLRHRFQLLRNQLNEKAEDWAALSYLEALVDEHIKQIKNKRLPQVVNEATHIYHELTEGQYEQVTYNDNQLMVRHKDGQIYHPIELSQSTKELLYIALRISLIKTLKPYYSLPIIIDDAFVHFDVQRKSKMIKYLRSMPENYQVLYFTCNRDSHIPAKQLVTLNKLEK